MNQTMTFPETIEEFIERHKFKDSEEVYTNGSELIQVYRIKQWIDAHPVKHGRWIPCNERLPEKHGYYIVQTDGSRNHVIDIAEYGLFWHNMKQEMMWNKASKVLAWMPLPEPYVLDEEE